MGLFDWLWGSKPRRSPPQIWMTREAKLNALIGEVRQCAATGRRVLVVAHFPDTRMEVADALDRAQIGYQFLTDRFDRNNARRWTESVGLLLADLIDVYDWQQELVERSDEMLVITVEKHPLRSHDEAIDVLARGWSPGTGILTLMSLDDPVMRLFAGEWVSQTLKTLGMKETEAIQSSFIDRRLQAALRKIEDQASGDDPADSLEHWLQRNYPGLSDSGI